MIVVYAIGFIAWLMAWFKVIDYGWNQNNVTIAMACVFAPPILTAAIIVQVFIWTK